MLELGSKITAPKTASQQRIDTDSPIDLSAFDREALLAQPRFNPLNFFHYFADKYAQEMTLLRKAFVHPCSVEPKANIYLEALSPQLQRELEHRAPKLLQPESFNGIGEHLMACALMARFVAQRMHLGKEEERIVVSAALTHDSNKAVEAMRSKLGRALRELEGAKDADSQTLHAAVRNELEHKIPGLLGQIRQPYSEAAYAGVAQMLERLGFERRTAAQVVECGRTTGHRSFHLLVEANSSGGYSLVPGELLSKIVHAVDDHTHSPVFQPGKREDTVYLSPAERMVASEFMQRYSFMLQEGLAIDQTGKVVSEVNLAALPSGLRNPVSYMNFQPLLARAINAELKALIDPDSDIHPDYFLKSLALSSMEKLRAI